MKNLIAICCLLAYSSHAVISQNAALDLLNKSIDFHDPKDNWKSFEGWLSFNVDFPGRPISKRKVFIDNKKQHFSFWAQYDDGLLQYEVKDNVAIAKWNASADIPKDVAEKRKITTDRAKMYKDYYTYLYGMPMKLKDPGTIIDDQVERVKFYGNEYDRIRVSYTPEVGKDIWYFYFNSSTHALEAYQFFHDESKNDGEYILFEGLKEIDAVKFPKDRKWYYNKDEKYLATDILIE